MEPSSILAELKQIDKPQPGKGRLGTLENPETYPDVPGHVIPIIEHEFEDFASEAARFMAGEIPEEEFIPFRLLQGVYGQRQPGVQMIRCKLPMGGVTPEQLECFADVVEEYAPLRKGHVTTRQNIQIHHIPLAVADAAIARLADEGLSSREGCGNTIRNVTGDPWAGICDDEPFDLSPYAYAFVRYFVRHPTTRGMPRKIKTSFGAESDRAISRIHDIAFISKVAPDGTRGVEIRVGGGTSIMPRTAPTIYDFVTLDDGEYLKVSEAIFRVFDRQEWLRANRARARIKVLVDKIGAEAFRTLVDAELEGDWVAEREYDVARLRLDVDERPPAKPPVLASPNGDAGDFQRFARSNVTPQVQPGFSSVLVKIPRGDLTPEQFRGLAEIVRTYTSGFARTTVQQNLLLRYVHDDAVYAVWSELEELGLGGDGAMEITDVVSCPGTDSCKLGITSSMGLNAAVAERVASMEITDPLTKKIRIKMSGCPNGCSQHHVGTIGFYGASIKVGEHTIPAYVAHLGGNYSDGDVVFGQRLKVRLPAKRVPDAVERWLRLYEAQRNDGETFREFVARAGTTVFEDEVRDLALAVEFSLDTMSEFIDWNRSEPFQVVRGEGECGV